MKEERLISYGGEMAPDQDVAAAGYIALSGTRRLALLGEARLQKRFTAQFVARCQNIYEARGLWPASGAGCLAAPASVFQKAGAASWWMAGEGGIMAALWNYFDAFSMGFEIELRKLPLLQETVEVCEVFEVNPYRLQSEGCALLTAENGGLLVKNLEKQGIPAAVIGRTRKSIGRRIQNGEICTFLDRPKPDELYKIQLTGGNI